MDIQRSFHSLQTAVSKTERYFLIEDEIEILETVKLPSDRLDKSRDLFLFSCYTGLAYTDMANLHPHNIIVGIDREYWIKTSRQKTNTKINVPLLPQALAILDKYKKHPMVIKRGRALPYMSNQKINDYLKEIAMLCGINKNMTFHLARHDQSLQYHDTLALLSCFRYW